MKIFFIIIYIIVIVILNAKIDIKKVSPIQNVIGAKCNCTISIEIEKTSDSIFFDQKNLFKIYGSNSGMIKGSVNVGNFENTFTFIPQKEFFSGEIINVSFGPLYDNHNDTLRAFHWRFTTEIRNPTNANLDSLKRFPYPSFDPIAIDYDKDGHIDIVTSQGGVILNDGKGNFHTVLDMPEMYGLKYIDDLNNDGYYDLIVSSDIVVTYIGDDNGNYNISEELYPYNMNGGNIVAKGDLNGDGFTDLIGKEEWGTYDYLWRIFINDGNGQFIRDTNATYLINNITKADLIDMNMDGTLDLVLLNSMTSDPSIEFAGAYIYFNDGNGNFKITSEVPFYYEFPPYFEMTFTDLSQIFIIDYDLNGLNDIAAMGSMNGGLVVFQDSLKRFTSFADASFSGAESPAFFTSGDFNGDNRFDIITSNEYLIGEYDYPVNMAVTLNTVPICFGYWCDSVTSYIELGKQEEVGNVLPVTADVDNDGDLDIINSGYPTTINYNRNVITGIKNYILLDENFFLHQNYPNPFNNSTNIEFSLPSSGNTKIRIFDVLGNDIKILFDGFYAQGMHSINFVAPSISSGIYFYSVEFAGKTQYKKMIYLK